MSSIFIYECDATYLRVFFASHLLINLESSAWSGDTWLHLVRSLTACDPARGRRALTCFTDFRHRLVVLHLRVCDTVVIYLFLKIRFLQLGATGHC